MELAGGEHRWRVGTAGVTWEPGGLRLDMTAVAPLEVFWEEWRPEVRWGPETAAFELAGTVTGRRESVRFAVGDWELTAEEPVLEVQLAGPRNAPEGRVSLRSAQVAAQGKAGKEPPEVLHGIEVLADIRPEAVQLRTGRIQARGQPVEAEGTLPLGEAAWMDLWNGGPVPDWRQGQWSVTTQKVALEAVAFLLPAWLEPAGWVSAQVRWSPGAGLGGNLEIAGVSTRTTAEGLGLREASGQAVLENEKVTLPGFKAFFGGREIRGSGWLDLRHRPLPLMELRLAGENLPLVRSRDLVLRADLDLALRRLQPELPAAIAGRVTLRDGLLMRNLQDLVRPGVSTPAQRPPYFSVAEEPFAPWKLDLKVAGEKFMRVNTAVAKGVVSADLNLGGTLRDPVLTGQVRLDSGSVHFPYGRLEMERGVAEFGLDHPESPRLRALGQGQSQGFKIGLALAGDLQNPVVEFTSEPALNREEIVLLLTAGLLPDRQLANSVYGTTGRMALYLGQGAFSDLLGGGGAERFRYESRAELSAQGKETFQVEFLFNDTWSLLGEYDEYDFYNLDVRYRLGGKK